MKRFITILAVAAAMFASVNASAQPGIIAGISTNGNTDYKSEDFKKALELYHVGLTYKVNIGLGFAIQPSIIYMMKGQNIEDASQSICGEGGGATFKENLESKTGYLEVPIQLQWGIDLVAARVYGFAEPFIGYQLTGEEGNQISAAAGSDSTSASSEELSNFAEDAKNKLEVGLGVGLGVELLGHIQVSAGYYMNLGNLYDGDKIDAEAKWAAFKDSYKEAANYSGIKISLALLF